MVRTAAHRYVCDMRIGKSEEGRINESGPKAPLPGPQRIDFIVGKSPSDGARISET